MNLKHLPLEGAHNTRDLGGYPTADGRMTKWGLLYRSDGLNGLSQADWKILENRNVLTIIDLRSIPEAAVRPVPVPPSMRYTRFSLMKEMDAMPDPNNLFTKAFHETGTDKILESMRFDYGKTVFENLSCCADIFTAISEGLQSGAVLFMCSAGKDRTGIVAALLLSLCRVYREDIIADYMVSNVYNTSGINKILSAIPQEVFRQLPDPELFQTTFASNPETIIKLLDDLERYRVWEALSEHGFSFVQQDALRDVLTENCSQ